jgi:hypothetical protein
MAWCSAKAQGQLYLYLLQNSSLLRLLEQNVKAKTEGVVSRGILGCVDLNKLCIRINCLAIYGISCHYFILL